MQVREQAERLSSFERERNAIAVISFLAGFAVAMAARIISGGVGDVRGSNIIVFRLTLLSIIVLLQQFLLLLLLLLLSFCTSSSALIFNGTVGVRNFFCFSFTKFADPHYVRSSCGSLNFLKSLPPVMYICMQVILTDSFSWIYDPCVVFFFSLMEPTRFGFMLDIV